MCKFKDTTLGIKKLDFGVKRGAMAVFLTDGREVIVPISMFPDIKSLSIDVVFSSGEEGEFHSVAIERSHIAARCCPW